MNSQGEGSVAIGAGTDALGVIPAKQVKQRPKMLLLLVVLHKQPHKMQQQLVQRQQRLIPMLLQ